MTGRVSSRWAGTYESILSLTYGSIPIPTNDTIGGVITSKFKLMSFRSKRQGVKQHSYSPQLSAVFL
jgi:hypothetical protein